MTNLGSQNKTKIETEAYVQYYFEIKTLEFTLFNEIIKFSRKSG